MSLADYQPLCDRLGLAQGIPYTPKWSAASDFIQLIVDHTIAHKPATIVECSSGLTTLMLARCCATNGRGHVYSLENGAEYAANTRTYIARYGLENYATIIDAPLVPYHVSGVDYQWYELAGLTTARIDMLVIDGPPGFIQRHSRYPALPLLRERLADDCTIFMDDAARPDERELVNMWLEELPAARHEYIANERGCAILRITGAGRLA